MKQVLAALICIVTICGTCLREDQGHERIIFQNNSNLRLYLYGEDISYPDTSIYFGDLTKTGTTQIVNPNSLNVSALEIQSIWEQRLSHPDQDTLMVFVFDADVIETVPWSTVVHDYMVLKRYDLSLRDLQKMNWTVTYP